MDKNRVQTIANIALAFVGLTLGIVFFLISENNKDLSLILFSIAIASILYQFLGGIGEETTFQLGVVKFGGSAAIIAGFMYLFKTVIFTPAENNNLSVHPDKNWIPISTETGKVENIFVSNGKDTLVFPGMNGAKYVETRKKHEYQISSPASDIYNVVLKNQPSDTIGYVSIHNFNTPKLFNNIDIATDDDLQVFTLHPEIPDMNSSLKIRSVSLPFEIKVFNTSRFSIMPFIPDRVVEKKKSFLIPWNDEESYVVFLEQADSENWIKNKRYSKWLVKKIKHKLGGD